MSVETSTNKRIANNIILLYVRMLFVMCINLFSLRLVIKALGVEDYGVYNVIAGVVTSISGLTTVLSSSTQRFYSIAQGKGVKKDLQAIFSTSIRINVIIVLLIFIFAETVGIWFINTQLVIPENRMVAANWLYQTALISFAAAFLQTPFSAAIIAHEDMGLFAIISLIECILKFGAAAILFILNFDSLIGYSIFLSLVSFIILCFYIVISVRKYAECRYSSLRDKKLRNRMLTFSGWTLLTSIASIFMYQANTILVNLYFGPITNASRGIALQLNSIISAFTASFLLAVRPPIMKLYAEKNYIKLNSIFDFSNKVIFYLMLVICIPLLLEMDVILKIWLDQNDYNTILFSRLIVVYSMILTLNNPISFIIQAAGKVKQYCIYVEFFTIACMPITWILFEKGFSAASTFVVMIICIFFSHIARLYSLKKIYSNFSLRSYCLDFLGKALYITCIAFILCYIISINIDNNVMRLFVVAFSSFLIVFILVLFIGINRIERKIFYKHVFKLINIHLKYE